MTFCTASDPKRVRAFGRGLQPQGVRVQDEAKFKIATEGAGEGVPEVNIIGPGKLSSFYYSLLILLLSITSLVMNMNKIQTHKNTILFAYLYRVSFFLQKYRIHF